MELSTPFFVLMSLFLIQQSTVCDASWFQDLMARFHSSGHTNKDAHAAVYGDSENTGSLTHELIAAAAGWEAMRAYERQQTRETGTPPSHGVVKGILAALAAGAVDRLIETKGLDWIDAQRAKEGAASAAQSMVDEHERSQERGKA